VPTLVADGVLAFIVILAMTFGLVLPRMVLEHFFPPPTDPSQLAPRGKA
jgi:hypothetical protein